MWQLREISNGEKWSNNKSGQLDEYFDHVSEGRKGFLHHLMNMETFTATARVGLLLLSFLLTQVNPQDPALTALLPPEPPSPTQGGSVIFLYQGERNLYGNNVTYRIADLPTDSMKCWVDFETRCRPASYPGSTSTYTTFRHRSLTLRAGASGCRSGGRTTWRYLGTCSSGSSW